jgi:transposase
LIFESVLFRRSRLARPAARAAIKGAGARLWFPPPYSPDLNPIERAFAKVKHRMRIAQRRNIEDTWRKLGQIVTAFTETECANYFKNAGYASVKKRRSLGAASRHSDL